MTKVKLCKWCKRILIAMVCCAVLGAGVIFGINGHVVHSTGGKILSPEEAAALQNMDCILVLGCGVHADGQPTAMLADRLRQGVALYAAGAAPKLLMSGDHGQQNYNEVKTMKAYAVERDVPSQDVFMDHAGFSTYESIYRARDIFQAERILIVTQKYHLHRALYIANALGLEAYGVASDYRPYAGQSYRDLREILARNKDFFTSLIKPRPTFLGDAIPVFGNGDLTNDE